MWMKANASQFGGRVRAKPDGDRSFASIGGATNDPGDAADGTRRTGYQSRYVRRT